PPGRPVIRFRSVRPFGPPIIELTAMEQQPSPAGTGAPASAPSRTGRRRLVWGVAAGLPGAAAVALLALSLVGPSAPVPAGRSSARPVVGRSGAPKANKNIRRDGRIVFASLRDGRFHIHIINADGTGEAVLTSGPEQ